MPDEVLYRDAGRIAYGDGSGGRSHLRTVIACKACPLPAQYHLPSALVPTVTKLCIHNYFQRHTRGPATDL